MEGEEEEPTQNAAGSGVDVDPPLPQSNDGNETDDASSLYEDAIAESEGEEEHETDDASSVYEDAIAELEGEEQRAQANDPSLVDAAGGSVDANPALAQDDGNDGNETDDDPSLVNTASVGVGTNHTLARANDQIFVNAGGGVDSSSALPQDDNGHTEFTGEEEGRHVLHDSSGVVVAAHRAGIFKGKFTSIHWTVSITCRY